MACVGVVIAVMDVSVAEEYLSGHCLVTPDKRLMLHEQHAGVDTFYRLYSDTRGAYYILTTITKLPIGSKNCLEIANMQSI